MVASENIFFSQFRLGTGQWIQKTNSWLEFYYGKK